MRVQNLMDRLHAKGVCECCTGKAMILTAAALCVKTMGSAKATELLTYLVEQVREMNIREPDQTHH